VTQLGAVLDNRIVLPPEETEQNLCADKGYTGDPAKKIIEAHGYIPHVKERGEEIKLFFYTSLRVRYCNSL
jgi:putative transposase